MPTRVLSQKIENTPPLNGSFVPGAPESRLLQATGQATVVFHSQGPSDAMESFNLSVHVAH